MVRALPYESTFVYFHGTLPTCRIVGIADIVGRRFGSQKLPYNQQKSWAGSVSMFLFGFLVSVGYVWTLEHFFFLAYMFKMLVLNVSTIVTCDCRMLYYFSILGYFKLYWVQTIETVALVSFVATVVESLPTGGLMDDNISVPLASMVIAFFSFGHIGISWSHKSIISCLFVYRNTIAN